MKTQQTISFEQVSKLLEGLPPAVVGEVVMSLTKTMGDKYGDEPFELDLEIIEEQMMNLFRLMQSGLPYDDIIDKMISQGKIYKNVWELINKSIIKHVPINEQRNTLNLLLINGRLYTQTEKELIEIKTNPNSSKEQEHDVLPFAPNRKYQEKQFIEFDKRWSEQKSQTLAYDILSKERPIDYPADKMDSFLVSFRKWKKGA